MVGMESIDYREIIKTEFMNRRKFDPFYSLRKYSAELMIKVPHLSRVFSGERGLSKEAAKTAGVAIGLRNIQLREFCLSASALNGRSKTERNLAAMGLRRMGY